MSGFVASLLVIFLSALVISSALKLAGGSSIATLRRVTAVLLGAQILWLLFAGLGSVCSLGTGSSQPVTNAMAFGAFICAGFEFLVVAGAFSGSTLLSGVLAVIHPVGTFLVLTRPGVSLAVMPLVIASGAASAAVIAAFPLLLRERKTSRGCNAISLFQAFMKTWTSRDSADLETIIESHGEEARVTTRVIELRGGGRDVFLVFPGVHPGPFYPVGSYNLPGLMTKEFSSLGPVMTFHRPGGHERNLASNDQARRYVSEVKDFARAIQTLEPGMVRGPTHSVVGKATVSSTTISDDCLLTISFAPLGSDDLNPAVEDVLSGLAKKAGFNVSVVDAHNSLSYEQEYPDMGDKGWTDLFTALRQINPKLLNASYAHSDEVSFFTGEDITDNGIGLLMLETNGVKSVLILADANNAVPNLREEASKALESAGFRLIEFCTSDSHDLAAKGLTVARGYRALGEVTPVDSIVGTVVSLAKLADSRLSSCLCGSGLLTSRVILFGSKALEEFASIAQASSEFAGRYSKLAVASILVLFALSLVG